MQILIVCNRLAPTLELAHLVRALPALSSLEPVVLLGAPDLKKSLRPGIFGSASEHVLTEEIARPLGLNPGRGLNFLAKVARALRLHVVADLLLVRRASVIGEAALRAVLKAHPAVRAVVTADDRSLGFEFGIVHAARRRGIASVTVPFALSDPGGDWLRRQGRLEFSVDSGSAWMRKLKQKLAKSYPANIRTQGGVRLMFLTAGQVLGLQVQNALFPAPWAYGGGATDYVTLYSESIKTRQLELGVPANKLVVTGQCAMDELHGLASRRGQLKRDMAARYGLAPDQPTIVLAVPQHAEHGLMGASDHNVMTAALLQDLRAVGANLVLSLHPRSHPEDYRHEAQLNDAVIATQPLLEILPAADLFVATHSSTVRWAILLGIPTIVLDDFGVGANGMFDSASVTFVTERAAVQTTATALLARAHPNPKVSTNGDAGDLFDGASSQRVARMLESLCGLTDTAGTHHAAVDRDASGHKPQLRH